MFIVRISFSVFVCFLLSLVTSENEGVRHTVVGEADNCDQKSKDGDYLVIKYIGEYTDNGEKFDDS